jgi:hypothetical protein
MNKYAAVVKAAKLSRDKILNRSKIKFDVDVYEVQSNGNIRHLWPMTHNFTCPGYNRPVEYVVQALTEKLVRYHKQNNRVVIMFEKDATVNEGLLIKEVEAAHVRTFGETESPDS